MKRSIFAVLIAASAAMPATAFAHAHAELRPSQLAADTPAQLVVTVDHDAARPPAPSIDGASVRYAGEMSSTKIVNGTATRETSFIYTVVPRAAGTLAIPPIDVGGESTEPLRVDVAATPVAAAQGGAPSAQGAPAPGSGVRDEAREPTLAFVRLDVPKRKLYVGEAVPVKIRAYFRGGVSAALQGEPRIASPAFTLAQLSDKPAQTQVQIGGVPYLQATWTGVLSAAKPTADALAVELPVDLEYHEQRPQPRPARPRHSIRDLFAQDPFAAMDDDSFFDDPFFQQSDPFAGMDDMFDLGGPVRHEQRTLRDTAKRTEIVEVPETGRPTGYAGAIGAFDIAAEVPDQQFHVGEPVTLGLAVRGRGNFDRVDVAGIAQSADWKVYRGKPTFEQDPKDPLGGTKRFTQTLVPTSEGMLEIPAVALAFFDPSTGAYRTVHTEPRSVSVAASTGTPAAPASTSNMSAAPSALSGSRASTLVPMIRRPRFWLMPLALGALTLLLLALAGWRRSERIQAWRRSRGVDRGVRRWRAQLAAAERAGDPIKFFDAARTTLQLELARAWKVAPQSITAADVEARLGEQGRGIRDVFEQADDITYAPGSATPGALGRWRALVDQQLATLESSR